MLQCVAVCCSVLQCVAVYCSVLQCVAACCRLVQRVAVWCRVLQCVIQPTRSRIYFHSRFHPWFRSVEFSDSVLQYFTVCYIMLQSVAVCCSLLQSVTKPTRPRILSHSRIYGALRCSELQCVAVCHTTKLLQNHFSFLLPSSASTGSVAVCCSMLQHVAMCCSVSYNQLGLESISILAFVLGFDR